ncbi:epithelial-stromal interaction protein 1 isoform X2 [Electrophorus electricus]|uniref:epithelial-stromal interaction protein 1 isoform X2 n=1 Tax=Electrophorus electricus TaxID=8005 RepID=UPI0015D09C98|nr:epithelial-stromal interaction protein 1 isoform X2 [Electrophorus electricus]
MNPDSSGTMTPHHHDDGADGNRADKPLQHTQPADQRQLTHIEGYSTVPPNESRRSRMLRIAQKELEDLDRWQDEHRPGPIHLAPEKLGGGVPLAEVRQKQQVDANRAKLQKKLKKEEMNKRARQEEEEKNQKMKAVQREKANRLEMKKKQQEEERREQYQADLQRRKEEFLQRFERSSSVPMATSNSKPTSSWARGHKHREGTEELAALQRKKDDQRRKGEILEEKQSQQEDTRERQMESERLRLEARGSGRASESPPRPVEGGNVWQAHRPQDPALSPGPDRAEEEEEEEADHDWAVMRLQSQFPYYERELLEDIVSQCNGSYRQAYDLLSV